VRGASGMVTLLAALARDSQGAVVAFDVPVVDVGAERFANPQNAAQL
jgi:hypothetical protein